MKKVVLLLVAAAFSLLSANAQKENDLVISAGAAKELLLGDNMQVILVQAGSEQNELTFGKEVLKSVSVKLYSDVLEVMPEKALKNQTVYIIVGNVKQVTVGENTNIQSESVLQKGQINLYMYAGATARLKTSGRVDAFPMGDYEVSVRKTPLYPNASAAIN